MNILLNNGLPTEYKGVHLSTDFRNMINVELILQDDTLPESAKTLIALHQLYPDLSDECQPPSLLSYEERVAGLVWFYRRGKKVDEDELTREGRVKKTFDFEQDAGAIYAGFLQAYGIEFSVVDYMHWWEFLTLFENLPDDTGIKKAIYWRGVDTSKFKDKESKKHAIEMKKVFALEKEDREELTIDEINKKTQEYYNKRIQRR